MGGVVILYMSLRDGREAFRRSNLTIYSDCDIAGWFRHLHDLLSKSRAAPVYAPKDAVLLNQRSFT